ncbi:hypothetical protein K466DRAFT_591483, partial [Polyporus arcularius HHB13444]
RPRRLDVDASCLLNTDQMLCSLHELTRAGAAEPVGPSEVTEDDPYAGDKTHRRPPARHMRQLSAEEQTSQRCRSMSPFLRVYVATHTAYGSTLLVTASVRSPRQRVARTPSRFTPTDTDR